MPTTDERKARETAARWGVTRLADVTGLDRVGVPVWQAVRPMSRALSVHQGKGFDPAAARIGALMEAIESAHAEQWQGRGIISSWDDLRPDRRAAGIDDFAREPGRLRSDQRIEWVKAEPLGDTPPFFVPATCVSLDFTYGDEAGFARSSNGLAAHFSLAAATRHALHEVIERDARGAWHRAGRAGSPIGRIAPASIPCAWFASLRRTLDVLDVAIRVNRVPALAGLHVFVVELLDGSEAWTHHAAAGGSGTHESVEAALRAAVLEALQSRVTMIAGARDDLPLVPVPHRARPIGLGFPTPALIAEQPFPGEDAPPIDDAAAVVRIVEGLAQAGYRQIGRIAVSPPDDDVVTVKLFVPGLGDLTRERRPPAPCTS